MIRILKQCVAAYPDFEVVTYAALKSKTISWKCSLELGDIFFLLCDYAYSKKRRKNVSLTFHCPVMLVLF